MFNGFPDQWKIMTMPFKVRASRFLTTKPLTLTILVLVARYEPHLSIAPKNVPVALSNCTLALRTLYRGFYACIATEVMLPLEPTTLGKGHIYERTPHHSYCEKSTLFMLFCGLAWCTSHNESDPPPKNPQNPITESWGRIHKNEQLLDLALTGLLLESSQL